MRKLKFDMRMYDANLPWTPEKNKQKRGFTVEGIRILFSPHCDVT
jgi:hypothetical protein